MTLSNRGELAAGFRYPNAAFMHVRGDLDVCPRTPLNLYPIRFVR